MSCSSFCSFSIASWRGLYLFWRSVCGFLLSSVSRTAFCEFPTGPFVWAAPIPTVAAAARKIHANLVIAEDSQNFIFAENQIFFSVDFHIRPGILAEQDPVAGFYFQREPLAVFAQFAVAR